MTAGADFWAGVGICAFVVAVSLLILGRPRTAPVDLRADSDAKMDQAIANVSEPSRGEVVVHAVAEYRAEQRVSKRRRSS